ncbi:hypothetical protein CQA62_02185 [Helicobacter cholecystus]|uniref:Uncharacterized protein n=1 Tax=Helicobacter cholecystus TaxID=45498 RepID=A0A3D8IW14_9HELI|nr:hypothetical protein [Helicobacter cholecystus]RDU69479.1 hypothetical protein CQA62_02185 [Helicobacter cholecystus]VEJ24030.1 putative lipoprotein [Helicobacter cholecystus]
MKRILFGLYALLMCACSNLSDPRFSKDFYEEKMMQLTRKGEIIAKNKTQVVMFVTYLSELNREKYEDGEYFFVEISFEDEKLGIKDINFSLAGDSPIEIAYIKDPQKQNFYIHSPWNKGYLVKFEPVAQTELATLNLLAMIGKEVMVFDYSFKHEGIL